MPAAIRLIGVELFGRKQEVAIDEIRHRLDEGTGGYVCFVNVHTLTESVHNSGLRNALDSAMYRFPDGMPLVWLAHMKGATTAARVSGPDFAQELIVRERSRQQGIIGGAPGCAQGLAARFEINATTYSPPMREFSVTNARDDWHVFLSRCPGGVAPPLVWVALGAPKQELWMHTVSRMAPNTIFFGIGAALDFLSGNVQRAPVWMRNTGLEWTHRLIQEPRRLWKRYLKTNTKFLFLALNELMHRS